MKSGPFRRALWEYSQYKLGNAFHQGPSEYSLYKHGNAFHHSLWEYSLWNLWNSFHQGLREYLIIHYHHNLEVCIQTNFFYIFKSWVLPTLICVHEIFHYQQILMLYHLTIKLFLFKLWIILKFNFTLIDTAGYQGGLITLLWKLLILLNWQLFFLI